jgi:hypothetical protein
LLYDIMMPSWIKFLFEDLENPCSFCTPFESSTPMKYVFILIFWIRMIHKMLTVKQSLTCRTIEMEPEGLIGQDRGRFSSRNEESTIVFVWIFGLCLRLKFQIVSSSIICHRSQLLNCPMVICWIVEGHLFNCHVVLWIVWWSFVEMSSGHLLNSLMVIFWILTLSSLELSVVICWIVGGHFFNCLVVIPSIVW